MMKPAMQLNGHSSRRKSSEHSKRSHYRRQHSRTKHSYFRTAFVPEGCDSDSNYESISPTVEDRQRPFWGKFQLFRNPNSDMYEVCDDIAIPDRTVLQSKDHASVKDGTSLSVGSLPEEHSRELIKCAKPSLWSYASTSKKYMDRQVFSDCTTLSVLDSCLKPLHVYVPSPPPPPSMTAGSRIIYCNDFTPPPTPHDPQSDPAIGNNLLRTVSVSCPVPDLQSAMSIKPKYFDFVHSNMKEAKLPTVIRRSNDDNVSDCEVNYEKYLQFDKFGQPVRTRKRTKSSSSDCDIEEKINCAKLPTVKRRRPPAERLSETRISESDTCMSESDEGEDSGSRSKKIQSSVLDFDLQSVLPKVMSISSHSPCKMSNHNESVSDCTPPLVPTAMTGEISAKHDVSVSCSISSKNMESLCVSSKKLDSWSQVSQSLSSQKSFTLIHGDQMYLETESESGGSTDSLSSSPILPLYSQESESILSKHSTSELFDSPSEEVRESSQLQSVQNSSSANGSDNNKNNSLTERLALVLPGIAQRNSSPPKKGNMHRSSSVASPEKADVKEAASSSNTGLDHVVQEFLDSLMRDHLLDPAIKTIPSAEHRQTQKQPILKPPAEHRQTQKQSILKEKLNSQLLPSSPSATSLSKDVPFECENVSSRSSTVKSSHAGIDKQPSSTASGSTCLYDVPSDPRLKSSDPRLKSSDPGLKSCLKESKKALVTPVVQETSMKTVKEKGDAQTTPHFQESSVEKPSDPRLRKASFRRYNSDPCPSYSHDSQDSLADAPLCQSEDSDKCTPEKPVDPRLKLQQEKRNVSGPVTVSAIKKNNSPPTSPPHDVSKLHSRAGSTPSSKSWNSEAQLSTNVKPLERLQNIYAQGDLAKVAQQSGKDGMKATKPHPPLAVSKGFMEGMKTFYKKDGNAIKNFQLFKRDMDVIKTTVNILISKMPHARRELISCYKDIAQSVTHVFKSNATNSERSTRTVGQHTERSTHSVGQLTGDLQSEKKHSREGVRNVGFGKRNF